MSTAVQISPLETPALVVREVRKEDMRDFASYMLRADYQQHLASRYTSISEVQAFVARCLRRQSLPNRRGYYLASELKATRHVIGDGFVVVHGGKTAEVGWGLHPDLWGRGFATELARALLAHSQLSAGEIVRQSLEIAADIDIYTNRNIHVEELACPT